MAAAFREGFLPGGRLLLVRNALIQISPLRSPGFSRIRRSRQDALSRQASHRLKPGLQYDTYPNDFFKYHKPGLLENQPWRRPSGRDSFRGAVWCWCSGILPVQTDQTV